MNVLTKAEEKVMQTVWEFDGGFLKEIVDAMPEPRPHQNTVATILKILIEKEFIEVKPFGRMHRYLPLISKSDYSKNRINSLTRRFFNGSFSSMVSAMVKNNNMSIEELEMLVKQLKKEKK